MKYFIKKKSRPKVSFEVMRAVSRLNSYANKQASQSVVWDGKAVTNLSVSL
jgi:hypothetical protein|tara:strand:- start:571 stop:723 length:153 start_codon:yes stop_codon:yes gene_type:complete